MYNMYKVFKCFSRTRCEHHQVFLVNLLRISVYSFFLYFSIGLVCDLCRSRRFVDIGVLTFFYINMICI